MTTKIEWSVLPCRKCDEPVVEVRGGWLLCPNCWPIDVDDVADVADTTEVQDGNNDPLFGFPGRRERAVRDVR